MSSVYTNVYKLTLISDIFYWVSCGRFPVLIKKIDGLPVLLFGRKTHPLITEYTAVFHIMRTQNFANTFQCRAEPYFCVMSNDSSSYFQRWCSMLGIGRLSLERCSALCVCFEYNGNKASL